MTKWSAVAFDESQIDSTTEIVDLQGGNSNQRIKFSIPTLGQSVVPVHKITDIPLVNGFRQLEQDKVYRFVEEISSSDTLLVPAGWNGYIVGMHNPLTKYDYTGTGNALQTLNLSGTITDILDAGGGELDVVTFSAHGLLNGQYVNITGTTSYNQQKLLVSNVDEFSFRVSLPFVSIQSGSFDTGYDAINIMNMAFTNNDSGSWLLVTAATTSSVFRYNNIKALGFTDLGTIDKGIVVGYDGTMDFTNSGLLFMDMDKTTLSTSTFTNTNAGASSTKLLEFVGSLTRDVILSNLRLNTAVNNQSPIKINSNVTNAQIYVTNSPDNNISFTYFDELSGGRNETDPQITAFNNGVRANSSTGSESRSVGILVVNGAVGVAVPIEDLTPAPGDFTLDSVSQEFSLDTSTGVVTYDGLAPKNVIISYSIEAAQASGSAQDLLIDVRINGIQQVKTIRAMTTMGVGSFVSIASVGGLFTINPGDTFKLFKTNTTNSTNTDIQNTALLIR